MISNQLESMTDEEIDGAIADILAMFDDTSRDFFKASELYNSIFFRDLPAAFKKRACMALREHFTNKTNNYWNEQAQNEFL